MAITARRLPPMSPRVALLALAVSIVGIALYAAREALGPFIVGLLIVYLLAPPVEWLARLKIPRPIAILVVYVAAVGLVVEGLNVMLQPLVDQIRQFATDLPGLVTRLQQQLVQFGAVYRGLELPPALRQAIDEQLAKLATGDFGLDPTVLLPVLRATTAAVIAVLTFLIVPVWAFFILKDRPRLSRAFESAIPREWQPDVEAIAAIVGRVFGSWVRGQVLLGLTVGIATFIGLLVLGEAVDPIFTRFAVLLAVIAGVLELLPIIGPIIAAIPAILLAATTGIEAVGAAFLLYLGVQQLENNLLVPKIQGDATNLHPSVVMLALVVGGAIAGLLGAILALPIAAAGRDVYMHLFARLSVPAERISASSPEGVRGTEDGRVSDEATNPHVQGGDAEGLGGERGPVREERPEGDVPAGSVGDLPAGPAGELRDTVVHGQRRSRRGSTLRRQ
ncbi:MAG: AI-2E family transporter [Chloroflexi bacterium]|nr:AI-2E family transporter [Chloroflexota bacterium]